MKLKVLILGQGGREHALANHFLQSPLLESLWVCPGNAGMALVGVACVADDSTGGIVRFCVERGVDIVVPGPEAYMVTDLKAALAHTGAYVFAPDPELAQLESSKLYAKRVLREAGVATAGFEEVASLEQARRALAAHDFSRGGLVLKADGLAQGKGVVVCPDHGTALAALEELAANHGFPMLFEQELRGPELSAFALCQGQRFRLLDTACDYKRVTEDPHSANTGGMGAYSPCDFLDADDEAQIRHIFSATLGALAARGQHYEGFLFAGLMRTDDGLQVLEFNVRMGDPETQALLPRLQEDLLAHIAAAREGRLPAGACRMSGDHSVHVVAASGGYPRADMLLRQPITLPQQLDAVTFAGVAAGADGGLANAGGRVLGVTAVAASRSEARARAYALMQQVSFPGMHHRGDIGA